MPCSVHKNIECPKECSDLMKDEACKSLRAAADRLRKSREDVEEAKRDIEGALHELEEMTEKALTSRTLRIPRPILEDFNRTTTTATTRNFSKLVPAGPFSTEPLDDASQVQRAAREELASKQVEETRKAMRRASESHRVINPYHKNSR